MTIQRRNRPQDVLLLYYNFQRKFNVNCSKRRLDIPLLLKVKIQRSISKNEQKYLNNKVESKYSTYKSNWHLQIYPENTGL